MSSLSLTSSHGGHHRRHLNYGSLFSAVSMQDFSGEGSDDEDTEPVHAVPERPKEWEPFHKVGVAHHQQGEERRLVKTRIEV